MNIVFIVIATVMVGTSCHLEGMVTYATSIAQLSIGITGISLISFWSLGISLKNDLSLSADSHVNLRSMIK